MQRHNGAMALEVGKGQTFVRHYGRRAPSFCLSAPAQTPPWLGLDSAAQGRELVLRVLTHKFMLLAGAAA